MGNNNLRNIRKEKGVTLEALAEKTGFSHSYISRIEAGKRNVSLKNLELFADALGVLPQDLISEETRMIPVVGYVGAGSIVHLDDSNQGILEEVEAPDGATEKTVAVRIEGDCLGEAFNGWLAFYDDEPRAPTENMMGKLCICWLDDGRVLIKKLIKGSIPSLFTLRSNDAPIYDVLVHKAVKIGILREN